ncbi:MAG: hypothetical protein AAF772_12375 [Acidobacteriota bacterium]
MQRLLMLTFAIGLLLSGCATLRPISQPPPSTSQPGAVAEPTSVRAWLAQQAQPQPAGVLGAIRRTVSAVGSRFMASADADELIGARNNALHAGRDDVVALLAYEPAQGYVMAIRDARLDPEQVAPGERSELVVRYVVIGPDPEETLTVHGFTGLKHDRQILHGTGPERFKVPDGGGIVDVRIPITIPDQAPTGTYAIAAELVDARERFVGAQDAPVYIAERIETVESAESTE